MQFVQQLSALGNLDGVDRKQFQSTNINELAEELIESLAPWVYQTHHSIAFEESGQLIVHAIGSLIRDALRNLIENAVKHTEAGTLITVRVCESRAKASERSEIHKGFMKWADLKYAMADSLLTRGTM